ncbi:MAG: NUDIX hydrolase [Myxococcales bacterium]|nr:NUDIX hydrolase [Myxococcales bacterium]
MSEYPRPALAADVVALAFDGKELRVLLIERGHDPFAGKWALPGGFVEPTESAEAAASRELTEETGLGEVSVEQLYTFSKPGRDPRGWIVSVTHLALLRLSEHEPRAGDDAARAEWVPVSRAQGLAFDHDEALALALTRVRARAERFPFGAELLPARFTLRELQALHRAVLGESLDKRNFRKRALAWPSLVPLDDKETGVQHRRARYYRFDGRRLRPFVRAETGVPLGEESG